MENNNDDEIYFILILHARGSRLSRLYTGFPQLDILMTPIMGMTSIKYISSLLL